MPPTPPPKAPEFNPAVHVVIDPVLRPLGFTTRKSGAPTWRRRLPTGGAIFARIQRHPNAVDPYAGGRFKVEIEHSMVDRPYMSLAGRATLDQMLAPPELESVVRYQAAVISSLHRPPANWVSIYPEYLRETYMSNFDPDEPFTPGNFWHRFLSMAHVEGWARILASLLPTVMQRSERLAPGIVYLGSPIDLQADPLRPTDPVVLKPQQTDAPPPDPAWRPAPRRKGANLVCSICGKPIGPTDITVEKVGYEGIYHFECKLAKMGS